MTRSPSTPRSSPPWHRRAAGSGSAAACSLTTSTRAPLLSHRRADRRERRQRQLHPRRHLRPTPELVSSFNLGLHPSLAALRLAPGTSAGAAARGGPPAPRRAVTTFDPSADTGDPLSQLSPLLILASVLSVVIGAGVSANTVSLAALERRRENGLLRAAGASAGQVFRLLVTEAWVLALAGALAGDRRRHRAWEPLWRPPSAPGRPLARWVSRWTRRWRCSRPSRGSLAAVAASAVPAAAAARGAHPRRDAPGDRRPARARQPRAARRHPPAARPGRARRPERRGSRPRSAPWPSFSLWPSACHCWRPPWPASSGGCSGCSGPRRRSPRPA